MIFIWKGRGILSVVLLVGIFLILLFALPDGSSTYGFAIPLIISGFFSFILGNKWNNPNQYYIDPKSGQKKILKNQHTLFWINMEYWGLLFLVLGIGLLLELKLFTSLTISGILLATFIIFKYQKNRKVSSLFAQYEDQQADTNNRSTQLDRNTSKEEMVIEKKIETNTVELEELKPKDKEDHSRFMPQQ